MANKKISELDAASTLTGVEAVPVVQSGATKRAVAADLQDRTSTMWKDMLAPLTAAGVPNNNAPTLTTMTVGTMSREEYAFAINDYMFVQPFHANHDIKPGGSAYLHVHWTTDGTSTNTVKWQFDIMRALGHDQANFTQVASRTVEQAASGTAFRHMVSEVVELDALTLVEPDELILVNITRVTNGGTENTDAVFGLMVDLHYEADRHATVNKAPNFYGA